MDKKSFKRWIISSIILGLLPWLINLFVVFVFSGNMSFFNIFRISDLNFFVIVLCAFTLLDISNRTRYNNYIILGLFLIFSSFSLGICLFLQNFPITNELYLPILIRLTWISLIISILALIYTFIIQWSYYSKQEKINKHRV